MKRFVRQIEPVEHGRGNEEIAGEGVGMTMKERDGEDDDSAPQMHGLSLQKDPESEDMNTTSTHAQRLANTTHVTQHSAPTHPTQHTKSPVRRRESPPSHYISSICFSPTHLHPSQLLPLHPH